MRALNGFSEVYLHTGVSDMRLGMDRLSEKIRDELKKNPLAGGIYVFLSRCRRKVKLLYWDADGYAVWMKRLEAGVFQIEKRDGYEQVTGVELQKLLSGVELSRIKLRRQVKEELCS